MATRVSPAKLRKAVYAAAKAAFAKLQKQCPRETFYAFGLTTNDAANWLFPVANSEEGLRRTIAKYQSDGETDSGEEDLRWSFGDWSYEEFADDEFEAVNELLEAATQFDDLDDDQIEKQVAKLMTAIVAGLADLDQEGFFGEGADRENVAVMIVGDLDNSATDEYLQKLNPRSVVKKLISQRDTCGSFVEYGSRNVREAKALSITGDGQLLVTAGDYHVFAFRLPDVEEVMKKRTGNYQKAYWGICTVAVSLDGSELAIGWSSLFNNDGGIERWSIRKQKRIDAPPVGTGSYWCLDYSPDSTQLASAGQDKVIRIWNLSDCSLVRAMKGHADGIRSLRYSPDGKRLASIDDKTGSLRIWDPQTGQVVHKLADQGWCVQFTPDGKQLAVVSGNYSTKETCVRFWDVKSGKLVRKFEIGTIGRELDISQDGKRLVVASTENPAFVDLWDLSSGRKLQTLKAGHLTIDGVAFINECQAVAVVGWSDRNRQPLLVWDISTGSEGTK